MKHIVKLQNSEIVLKKWRYPTHRTKIMSCLEVEQAYFCAYTEYRFDPGCARDIEHFNPNLKNTSSDGYENWYAVSHRWNNKIKGTNWFAPCYSPSDVEVETVYTYSNGYYLYDRSDIKADNLAKLVGLNEPDLVEERDNYVKSLQYLIDGGIDLKKYFEKFPKRMLFRTAVNKVFGLTL